jgi:hypothetical protein
MVPAGELDAFGELSDGVAAAVAADTNEVCTSAELALAGRALWLHENGEADAGRRLAGLVESGREMMRATPDPLLCVELLRPVVGVDEARERLAAIPPIRDASMAVQRVRAGLQLHAIARDWAEVERLLGEAEKLAGAACAPVVTWVAEWAGAMRDARGGRHPAAADRARRATDALAAFGERYTAARLRADIVPLLDGQDGFVAATAAALEAAGARATAAQLTG